MSREEAPDRIPLKGDPKLEHILTQFSIDDREGLRAAIDGAIWAFTGKSEGVPDFRERDTLDELAPALSQVIQILKDPLNSNSLAQYWRSLSSAEQSFLPSYLPDFVTQLEFIRQTAPAAHRKRQNRGPLPSHPDLQAAVEILADYWEKTLGRKFTHDSWANGHDNRREPVTQGERFVYFAIDYFAPDRLDGLETILRKFASRPADN